MTLTVPLLLCTSALFSVLFSAFHVFSAPGPRMHPSCQFLRFQSLFSPVTQPADPSFSSLVPKSVVPVFSLQSDASLSRSLFISIVQQQFAAFISLRAFEAKECISSPLCSGGFEWFFLSCFL